MFFFIIFHSVSGTCYFPFTSRYYFPLVCLHPDIHYSPHPLTWHHSPLRYIIYPGETGSQSVNFNPDATHKRWRVEQPPIRRLGHLEPATAFGLTNNYGNDPYKGYSLVHKKQVCCSSSSSNTDCSKVSHNHLRMSILLLKNLSLMRLCVGVLTGEICYPALHSWR